MRKGAIVPKHGSRTFSTTDFTSAVAPSESIFTNGYLNRFDHPKPEVFEQYQSIKGLVYKSYYSGTIKMDFVNRNHIQILIWRNQDKHYWYDTFESAN
jgi:competence protein ComEC